MAAGKIIKLMVWGHLEKNVNTGERQCGHMTTKSWQNAANLFLIGLPSWQTK